jgi:hypothetical protein
VKVTRRGVLRAAAAWPAAALALPADARDYGDAAELFAAVEALAANAEQRLEALSRVYPPARRFAASARADLARHRKERARLSGRAAAAPARPDPVEEPASLSRLRAVLADLMHACAEGLPALRRQESVRRLGEHIVDLSRLVTIVDLWIAAGDGDE